VFDNDINHIPMNSGFNGETRILHSDESGFQRSLEGTIVFQIPWAPTVSVRASKSASDPHRLTVGLAGIRR